MFGQNVNDRSRGSSKYKKSATYWLYPTLQHKKKSLKFHEKVEAGDGLPEKMCVQCVLQVSRAFTFKQQCERSDTTLRSYFQSIQDSMTTTVTVNDETTGTQSVEVQFNDPTNGEKCFLVVQQIQMMNPDDTLVTFSDDNKIVGNVICQEDVVDTEANEPNDSLSEINFANDDVIKLEDSSSLALVDVEDLESEIITDAYGK